MNRAVKRSNRRDVQAAGFSGVRPITDLQTGKTFNVRTAVGSYNHMDYQPETIRDYQTINEITNNRAKDPGWPVRQIHGVANNGDIFALALFTFWHSPTIYTSTAFRPRNTGPNDDHSCIHMFTSAAERPGGINNQYRRAHDACIAAEGATPPPYSGPTHVDYIVEVTSGPVNIRSTPDAQTGKTDNIVGQVRNPRRLQIDAETRGVDGYSVALFGRIIKDSQYNGNWIALRLTNEVAKAPVVTPPPPPPTLQTGRAYIVVDGDTLCRIGLKTATRWQDIAHANGIHEPWTIWSGMTLRIPA